MHITENTIEQLAKLCCLDVASNSEFRTQITQDLEKILLMMDQLREINTDGIEPMSHPLDLHQPLAEDQITETDVREQMQRLIASEYKEDGLYLVPQVLEAE